MSKKILTSLAISVLLLAGCGETPEAQTLLDEAMQNAFTIDSANFAANMEFNIEDVDEISEGNIKIDFVGKGEGLMNPPQKVDYEITLDAQINSPEDYLTASGKFAFKLLEDAFYAKLSDVVLDGSEDIAQVKPFIQMFSNNWYKLDYEKLGELSGEENPIIAQQEAQKKVMEAYKKLLSENQLLLASNIRKVGGEYLVDVTPNFDVIFTKEFIDEGLRNLIEASLPNDEEMNEEIFPTLDEKQIAQLPQIKAIAKQIWEEGNIVFTMGIDKKSKIANTSEMSGSLDLAKLDTILKEFENELELDIENEEEEMMDKVLSGKVTFSITSTNSNINKAQNIEAPEDAIDFDPLAMMGMQPMDNEIMMGDEIETENMDYEGMGEMMEDGEMMIDEEEMEAMMEEIMDEANQPSALDDAIPLEVNSVTRP